MYPTDFTIHSSPETLPPVEVVHFAGNIHPSLKVKVPIVATLVREGGSVRAVAPSIGLTVTGTSSGEALDRFGRALADRYYSGADDTLRTHIEERTHSC